MLDAFDKELARKEGVSTQYLRDKSKKTLSRGDIHKLVGRRKGQYDVIQYGDITRAERIQIRQD